MSLRSFSKIRWLVVVPVLALGLGFCGLSFAASVGADTRLPPPVQTYADQALPVPPPPPQTYYNSPLEAGTLTLQDVLEAHRPAKPAPIRPPVAATTPTATAPILTPSTQSSSESLMMSQGMKSVLQKVGGTEVAPVNVSAAAAAPVVLTPAESQAQPVQAPSFAVKPLETSSGLAYQPGQAPHNLGAGFVSAPASPPLAVQTPAPPRGGQTVAPPVAQPVVDLAPLPISPAQVPAAPASAPPSKCDENIQKWEKTCVDAGYPASYVGKIIGETRTGCVDGALHDVWVSNSCMPVEKPPESRLGRIDALCGEASNKDSASAPSTDLCASGIAGAVSGEGPWTWACSGVNGGTPAACTALKIEALVNGICGSANGISVAAAPENDLCAEGSVTQVTGSGPWTWTCKGSGRGKSESCIASKIAAPKPVAAVVVPVVAPVPAPAPAPAVAKSHLIVQHAFAPVPSGSKQVVAPNPVIPAPEPKSVEAPVAPSPTVASPVPSVAPSSVPSTTSSDDLCGASAQMLAYKEPEKDLCRSGTASVVNGEGPWSWSCTSNEGVTSSCRTLLLEGDESPTAPKSAPQTPVSSVGAATPSLTATRQQAFLDAVAAPPQADSLDPLCGVASSQPSKKAPVSGLCKNGVASLVRNGSSCQWTCTKKTRKISCEAAKRIDAACGAANGTALKSTPYSGLCASGTPGSIDGTGPWSWSCGGVEGGASASCAATLQETPLAAVNGACGGADGTNVNAAPSDDLCAGGASSGVSGFGPWTWSCSGSNGGAVASCSANKIPQPKPPGPLVNGLCGSANGAMTSARPFDNLCAFGAGSAVVGNGPWNWNCIGENGGMSVSCTAPLEPPAPIDGSCGGANGVSTIVMPKSGLCDAGITGAVSGKGPWTWTCSGVNGGAPASCFAPVAGRVGSLPSSMTQQAGDS